MMANDKTRVYFDLDPKDWHGHPSEGLWAEKVEPSDTRPAYQLMNSPFFVTGVSFLDIICVVSGEDGRLHFSNVISRSGHSTFMMLTSKNMKAFDDYWMRLQDEGCTYESSSIDTSEGEKNLYSVDVPEFSDLQYVSSVLEEGARAGVWVCQAGHVARAQEQVQR